MILGLSAPGLDFQLWAAPPETPSRLVQIVDFHDLVAWRLPGWISSSLAGGCWLLAAGWWLLAAGRCCGCWLAAGWLPANFVRMLRRSCASRCSGSCLSAAGHSFVGKTAAFRSTFFGGFLPFQQSAATLRPFVACS